MILCVLINQLYLSFFRQPVNDPPLLCFAFLINFSLPAGENLQIVVIIYFYKLNDGKSNWKNLLMNHDDKADNEVTQTNQHVSERHIVTNIFIL